MFITRFFIILILLVILNYLINAILQKISFKHILVRQKPANDINVSNFSFKLSNTSSSSISNKSRELRKSSEKKIGWSTYYRLREETDLTKTFNIEPKICNGNRTGISIFITIRANDFYQRQILPTTWVEYARLKGICVYFLIGRVKDKKIQDKNYLDSREHQDVIQGNFIDHYYNFTLKSISLLRWANTHCKQDHFIIKVDDDVIFQIDWLLENNYLFKEGNIKHKQSRFKGLRFNWR